MVEHFYNKAVENWWQKKIYYRCSIIGTISLFQDVMIKDNKRTWPNFESFKLLPLIMFSITSTIYSLFQFSKYLLSTIFHIVNSSHIWSVTSYMSFRFTQHPSHTCAISFYGSWECIPFHNSNPLYLLFLGQEAFLLVQLASKCPSLLSKPCPKVSLPRLSKSKFIIHCSCAPEQSCDINL